MTETVDPRQVAEHLRAYAEHFVQRDWDYTRDKGDLRHIRYADDFRGHNGWPRRIQRALRQIFGPPSNLDRIMGMTGRRERLGMARHYLRTDDHLPDGVLDGGGIITFWEETGEYLQFVQPSVGSLIANWLEAEPDNPHAQIVAAEMKRIQDRYTERLCSPALEDVPGT